MFDPHSHHQLRQQILTSLQADRPLLDALRAEVRPLGNSVRRIQPRNATSISLVGTDGGNNSLRFDPFLVQIIRVVDSSNNEYCLEVLTPNTDILALSARQFHADGSARTALGEMMRYLGVRSLSDLSEMIRGNDGERQASRRWTEAYRELVEWAILFAIVRTKDFATDTLLVFDGFLRSKAFAGDLFRKYWIGIEEGIARQFEQSRRRLYIAGIAKKSQVLDRYRLAMALEHVMATDYPAYVEIPTALQEKAYRGVGYGKSVEPSAETGTLNRSLAGKMYFVKFGNGTRDPIWPVDIFLPQAAEAPTIMGYLLADAQSGFPTPFYPLCLQQAHQNAALVEFDFDILQDQIFDGIRDLLGKEAPALDAFRLLDTDPGAARYS